MMVGHMGFTRFEDLRYECRMVEHILFKFAKSSYLFAKSSYVFAAKLVFLCSFFHVVELLQYGVLSLFYLWEMDILWFCCVICM